MGWYKHENEQTNLIKSTKSKWNYIESKTKHEAPTRRRRQALVTTQGDQWNGGGPSPKGDKKKPPPMRAPR